MNGIQLEYAVNTGIRIKSSEGGGMFIESAGGDGIRINNAEQDGVSIDQAKIGLRISQTQRDGIIIENALDDGIEIQNAGDKGIIIFETVNDGINIQDPGQDGLFIFNTGRDGVRIRDARSDGIFVGNAVDFSMNIQGFKSSSGGPDAHIAQIYNLSSNTSPDVLALKVGRDSDDGLGAGVNFITFYDGNDKGVGRIEGNGSDGVMYGTSGADFAECLPRLSEEDIIEDGDIIGVVESSISHNTTDAIQLMVITDRPAVLGNQKSEDSPLDEKVSFIGHVPVKVVGSVQQGDWIVPSGLHDGIGIALSPEELTLEHRIVGRAWETNLDPKLKKVNCAVGLDQSEAKDVVLKNMQGQIVDLQSQIDELRKVVLSN